MNASFGGSVASTDACDPVEGVWSIILWAVWAILMIAGLYGVFLNFTQGHKLAGYGSYVPWGLWIGLYFLCVGVSGGAFLIGAAGYILGRPGFRTSNQLRASIVLSVACLLPAFIGVGLDLGRTERLFNIIFSPSFTSMMAFNAWMYNIFLGVAALCWLLTFAEKTMWLKPLLVLGAAMSALFPSQSGVFFEAVRTNPFWHSPILSVLFLASAVALGGAGLLLLEAIAGCADEGADERHRVGQTTTLRRVTAGGIIVYAMFEFAEFSIAFWNPGSHSPQTEFLLFGGYWWVFWGLHVCLGVLIPLLFLLSRTRALWTAASLLALVGFAAARMSVLVPGQIVGQIPGLEASFQDPKLVYAYHPSTMEYLVGCFMIAVAMTLAYIGVKAGGALSRRLERAW
jgi:molybdopterin-containing oxidoreductase family membrane subunit